MGGILSTGLLFAEWGNIPSRDDSTEQAKRSAYKPRELTESERIILDIRRQIREEKQREKEERRFGRG
jgi:hypothetical protein